MSYSQLRVFRKGCGLTLTQVAQKTGLSPSFLSDIERGESNPSLETLRKLAALYETDWENLVDEEHVEMGEGVWIRVSRNVQPETIRALSELIRCVADQFEEIAKAQSHDTTGNVNHEPL